jgi:membrane protease YdiL (CAAX protease family)
MQPLRFPRPTPRAPAPPVAPERLSRRAWKEELLEVLVFLFLVVPSLVLGLFVNQATQGGFVLIAVATIFRDLALVSLIMFFLWRNGEPIRLVGWNFRHGVIDVLIGFALFIPTFIVTGLLNQALQTVGLSGPAAPLPSFLTPSGGWQFGLAAVLVVVVAVAEETIFRGYLILRFENVLRSVWLAVVLSAIIFSIGHGYEGSAGVITVGVMGVVFALVYIWRRSLVAPITMHFLQDFLGIVLLPLLGLLK